MDRTKNQARKPRTSPTAADNLHFEPARVLAGLAPKLVITLAQLVGSSLEDLQVTVQLLPWGDRATLAAYGAIEMDDHHDGRGRKIRVLPECEDLTWAAHELVTEAVDPKAVARLLDATVDHAPIEEMLVNLDVASEPDAQRSDNRVHIPGVVQEVHDGTDGPVFTVAIDAPKLGLRGPDTLRISTRGDLHAHMHSKVWVAFAPEVLGEPVSIAVEGTGPHRAGRPSKTG